MSMPAVKVLGIVTLDAAANSVKKLRDVFTTLDGENVTSLIFTAARANTGVIYIGDETLVVSTPAGVITYLQIPGTSAGAVTPTFELTNQNSLNAIPIWGIAVGATVQNDKVYITAITT